MDYIRLIYTSSAGSYGLFGPIERFRYLIEILQLESYGPSH